MLFENKYEKSSFKILIFQFFIIISVVDPRLKMDYHQVNEWEDEWIDMVKNNMETVYTQYGGAAGNDHSIP